MVRSCAKDNAGSPSSSICVRKAGRQKETWCLSAVLPQLCVSALRRSALFPLSLPVARAPSPPLSAGFVAASRTAHSVPCLSARARRARARVSDYSRHLGPPPYSPSLIKEQFHLLSLWPSLTSNISFPLSPFLSFYQISFCLLPKMFHFILFLWLHTFAFLLTFLPPVLLVLKGIEFERREAENWERRCPQHSFMSFVV